MNQLSHARRCLTRPPASGLTGTKITVITAATAIPAARTPHARRLGPGTSLSHRYRPPLTAPSRPARHVDLVAAPDHLYLHQPGHGHRRPADRNDADMTSTPPSGHKPARRRAAVAVLIAAAALGTAAIPAFAARATYISPGNYLDLVIGRGWTEAAYQHWLTATVIAALLPPPPCSQGPLGAKPEPQPQPNPAPGRTTAAHQGPEVNRTNRAATSTPDMSAPGTLDGRLESGRIGRRRATGGGG